MIKIIGGDFSNNGQGGIFLGKGVKAEISGATTNYNGGYGVGYHSESEVALENHTAIGNKSYGLYQINSELLDSVGLPENIDVNKFNELIELLRTTKPDERKKVVYSSFLSGTLAILADSTTIVVNILDFVNQLPPLL